jgi:hypothetical protein
MVWAEVKLPTSDISIHNYLTEGMFSAEFVVVAARPQYIRVHTASIYGK